MSDIITLNLRAAAAMLQMSPLTLRKKAAAGKVPAHKPGKSYVFLLDELHEYLKASKVCPSISAKIRHTTGPVSALTVSVSGSQLAQRIKIKRMSLKLPHAATHGGRPN